MTSIDKLCPPWEVKVVGETIINPSEDPVRVIRCLQNSVNGGFISVRNNTATISNEGIQSLHHVRIGIKSRLSAGVARRLLDLNRSDNTTWILLNKQAAYCGIIALVENWNESVLGPIRITIQSTNLDQVLDWLLHWLKKP